ncbi:unnamed protein product [Nezara viridula]|uniref:ornithine decarboxylase n=1 Tax=Nezara viridula TaxID=85310 RepID=A0A9P0E9R9_NEZVI|nr:unnamed protein product [Nezara viridula]
MKIDQEYIRVVGNNISPKDIIRAITDTGKQDEAFYVMNVGEVIRKHELWLKTFPKIKPFYAVKCNDSKVVLRLLAALGTGFDCASKGEISRVMSLGVPAERIIYANPAKPSSHIKYAAKVGVNLLTFDNQSELFKIKELHPKAKLVLRIRCDAKDSQCPLGMKFGADKSSIKALIQLALELGLELAGVSFHVGSGCRDLAAFSEGVLAACDALTEMVYCGADPYILDIGGGFLESTIHKVSLSVNEALESVPHGISIIAEPGRYYVDSAYTLATAIHGIRGKEYYINDGVYGSFNCVLYDHANPLPIPLKETHNDDLKNFKIWGPTCDSLDMVNDNVLLPELEIGDWLVWECMGAYTLPVCSTFNGFPVPNVFYIATEDVWKVVQDIITLANPEDQFDPVNFNVTLLQTVSS